MSKIYMVYRKKDFFLYAASLVIFTALGWFALGTIYERGLLLGLVFFLLVTFVLKHGAEFDFPSFGVLARGLLNYPLLLAKEIAASGFRLGMIVALFLIALLLEGAITPYVQGTILLSDFPFQALFYLHFGGITAYRTKILWEHLRKSEHVQNFLLDSNWAPFLPALNIRTHIVHAYITGILCHLALVAPAIIFWKLTQPTCLRELLLLVLFAFHLKVVRSHPWADSVDGARFFHDHHAHAHISRFHFTLLHGHHHDAIPSGLIGCEGVGLLEAAHRPLARMSFFHSCTVYFVKTTLMTFFDIRAHQYIPGVFPYTRFGIEHRDHHMAHHFMSLRPLGIGMIASPFMQWDFKNGYSVENSKVHWYLSKVATYENLDPELLKEYKLTSLEEPPTPSEIFLADLMSL